MALTIVPTATTVFTGVDTSGGYSFADLRTLGFFEAEEPVALGSCYLSYDAQSDPVIGVSTFNVGVPSTGQISIDDLAGAVRELKLELSGSGSKVNIADLQFSSELENNIRKTVAITTNCVITSDDPTVAALRVTGGYDNLRINIDGQVLGAAGVGGTTGTGGNGVNGGASIDVTNTSGIPAKIEVNETGQVKAGGGGGGAGENGVNGTNCQYDCGQRCNGCQRPCRGGCCYDCGGGFYCCFDPCCSLETLRCNDYGGGGGAGGVGGTGRGGDRPSGSLDGGAGGAGGPGGQYCATAGTDGGDGGAGADFGQYGSDGNAAPSTGGAGPGSGGHPGFAITGGYTLVRSIAGIVTGILPDPV